MTSPGRTRRFLAVASTAALAGAGLVALAAPVAHATTAPAIESRRVAPVPVVLGPSPAAPTLVAAAPHPSTGGIHASSTGSTFVVNYDAGFNANPAAKAAFQYAVNQWSSLVTSSVPIEINASFTALGSGILGSAGPDNAFRNFAEAPQFNTWYPVAMANALHGSDLDPGNPDIDAQFSSSFPSFYFGTDGNTAGKVDFASVVLHELGHGLGFLGIMNVSGSTGTCCIAGSPFTFDRFTTSNGTSLLSFTDGSAALATALQGTTVRFTGPNATAANGGLAPRLYAPNPWQGGSSYSHLDDATFPAGNPNSLMTPSIGANEVIHSPGPITLGIFADSGWVINDLPSISVGGASVVEGKAGTRNLRFNVALSAPTAHTVTAHYATGNSSAIAGSDYNAASGTVSIPAGATTGSINVGVRGDNTVEPTEKFALVLSSPAGANLGRKSVSGTILNDDPHTGVQISVGNAAIEEGAIGNRTLRVTVTLSSTSTHAVSVGWATSDGTATAGSDYTGASGTVNIASGATRGTISITVSPDASAEANESIKVTLSSPVGAVIRRSLGTATINNDD